MELFHAACDSTRLDGMLDANSLEYMHDHGPEKIIRG
jgi:hypothetical protein